MSYVLYLLILLAFCLLMPRISFFKKSGLSAFSLTAFFLVRAAAGLVVCFMGYRHLFYLDSLAFHNISLTEYHWLTHTPGYFLQETFHSYTGTMSDIVTTHPSFWNNLKTNLIVKPLAVLNIFTLRNFYINTLVFNILIFTGSIALYRVLKNILHTRGNILALVIFLFPTGLIYTATIHREGLIWLFFSFLLMAVYQISQKGFDFKHVAIFLFCLIMIFGFRSYLFLLTVPALTGWWLSLKFPSRTAIINVLVAFACIVFFFSTRMVVPQADFPSFVAGRLSDFLRISQGSNTYLPMAQLSPTFSGFMFALPQAIVHSFLLPMTWKIQNWLMLPFALELLMVQFCFLILLIKGKITTHPITAFIVFVCFFSMLMIGYTIPNLGAIMRYRSIYLHLLFILIIAGLFAKRQFGQTYNDI